MTLDEALSAAVEGERVTAAHMAPGWFVDYPIPFNGWYRNTPNGSRSQFIETEEDRAADWGVVVELPKRDAWGRPNDPSYVAAVDKLVGFGAPRFGKTDAIKRDEWGRVK